ncbi:hypothetical protein CT090_20820 [Salmonella enterica subsp. enterica]|nr:hypothetical protein [Salmonella enterica subsp. enterica]EHI3195907.1 hypothetical protein [Salmonella enterica]
MNKLIAFLLLMIMAPALGVVGGMILSFWNDGNDRQPFWGKLSGAVTILVIALNLKNVFSKEVTRAKNKHRKRMLLAIFSVIVFPIIAGTEAANADQKNNSANDFVTDLAMNMFAYLPFGINCWYISLEGGAPLWRRFTSVTSTKNIEQ